jgi:hypothetical protein
MMNVRDIKRVRRLQKIAKTLRQELAFAEAQCDFAQHRAFKDGIWSALKMTEAGVDDFESALKTAADDEDVMMENDDRCMEAMGR